MGKIITYGNRGERIRSDCQVILELTDNNGIDILLNSKVKSLYGDSIIALAKDIFNFYGILNARIIINDSGSLPNVISARIEAAIKQLIESDKEYLPDFHIDNSLSLSTLRDRHRISRLYLPGNSPGLMINAGLHHPDGIILDLEDAVAPEKKNEARFIVRNALRAVSFYGAERMVRINQIPSGLADLDFIFPHRVNLVLIPKCETIEQIKQVNERIGIICMKHNITQKVWLMPIIESAKGVTNAYDIARSAHNIVAMAIGLEDFTADLGISRTKEGTESFAARSSIVPACKAAGIQAIDSVFSDVEDLDTLQQTALQSKTLGFVGMGCIHPRQIKTIQDAFAPGKEEIEKAKKIVLAFEEALSLCELRDGMTISTHHHLRDGDLIANHIFEIAEKLMVKDLVWLPSASFPCHDGIIHYLENGTINRIEGIMNGPLDRFTSAGKMKGCAVLRSHGGRVQAIQDGEVHIDIAILAAPTADSFGNGNALYGPSACGVLGHSLTDYMYADRVIVVTDNLTAFP